MKITRSLGKYITEHYALPDHRGDEAYQSWQEDYEAFQSRINAMYAKKNEQE